MLSGYDRTAVVPVMHGSTNGPATRRLRAQARLQVTIRDSISRADVAQFVIHELELGGHLLTAPTVTAT